MEQTRINLHYNFDINGSVQIDVDRFAKHEINVDFTYTVIVDEKDIEEYNKETANNLSFDECDCDNDFYNWLLEKYEEEAKEQAEDYYN